ncbi:MAG: hypothetical protein JO314_11835 [Acidobacteria bacterium]|nr:hypothetical protein [Acidobacteriota bacterium]
MYKLAGEDLTGRRCPGDACSRWQNAAGTYEDKCLACIGCGTCEGNPPPEEETESSGSRQSEDEIEGLVDDIQDIAAYENAGLATDWSCYSFEYPRLVTTWREAENHLMRIQSGRLQSFLLGWMKKKD